VHLTFTVDIYILTAQENGKYPQQETSYS